MVTKEERGRDETRRDARRRDETRGGAGSFLLMFALDILRQDRGRNAHSIVVLS